MTAEDLSLFQNFRIDNLALEIAGVRRVTDEQARNEYGIRGDGDMAGIIFPYFDPVTLDRMTARLRRDHPDVDEHGKPDRKYMCPWGDNRHLYFTCDAGSSFADVGVDALIVEAEKSALTLSCLAERINKRWLVMATGGCWGAWGKVGAEDEDQDKDRRGALPDFNRITWTGRKAIIIFDSNVATNPEVQRARGALANELRKRGARVFFVNLEQEPGVNGPDDFIARHSDAEAVQLLESAVEFTDSLPTIKLHPGESPKAVDEAEKILVRHSERLRIFQRAAELVRIITLPEPKNKSGLRREAGTVMLAPLSQVALTEHFDRLATWQRDHHTKNGFEPVRVDCPEKIAASYKARIGSWKLPDLTGIISAPIMRRDGTVLCRYGYDLTTGLYLTEDWPGLNTDPSPEDAKAALDVLLEPFSEFPFLSDWDKAVLAAAILTALQRRLLASAPIFGFGAPTQRTGKSLLAEGVAIIATGRPAPAMAVSREREEIKKIVLAALREGHSVINLDNIEQPLGSPALAQAVTQPEYSDRVLGESRTLRLPTNVTWTATGNNLSFRGDLSVRVLLCRLDAQMERPEERFFKIPNLKSYLIEHRIELVTAALTVLRGFVVAGRPDQNLTPWGGFDEWSDVIRAPLVWLGMADPCQSRKFVIEDDPDREAAEALMEAWHSALGSEPVQTARVVECSESDQGLHSALLAVASAKNDPSRIDTRRLGAFCREWHDRILSGLSLRRAKGYGNARNWKIENFGMSGMSGMRNQQPGTAQRGNSGQSDLWHESQWQETDSTDSIPDPDGSEQYDQD